MRSRSNILLMTKDVTAADLVKVALKESKGMTLAGICQELAELLQHHKVWWLMSIRILMVFCTIWVQ